MVFRISGLGFRGKAATDIPDGRIHGSQHGKVPPSECCYYYRPVWVWVTFAAHSTNRSLRKFLAMSFDLVAALQRLATVSKTDRLQEFLKWNLHMCVENTQRAFSRLDSLYGCSELFTFTHEFFSKSEMYSSMVSTSRRERAWLGWACLI